MANTNVTNHVESLSLDDDSGASDQPIKLVSKEGTGFSIKRKFAYISQLVKTSVEQDSTAEELDLTVTAPVLRNIVRYMEHHQGAEAPVVEKPLRSKVMADVCKDPFDAKFIDEVAEDKQAIYDLILAANYMYINGLLHLACAKVGSWIKGQPLDKIKDILQVNTVSSSSIDKSDKNDAKES